jgi:hypothetical protein
MTEGRNWNSIFNPAFRSSHNAKTSKRKIELMKLVKNILLMAVAATLLFQTSAIGADDNRDHRDAIINWTKHVPAFLPPGGEIFATIVGTGAGDVGTATLLGDAFNPVEGLADGSISFEAEYRFAGAKHSLTVRFRTVQAPDNSGVIIGVVTDGWLKGNVVIGHYQGYPCDEGIGVCFDGTFIIKKGSKAQN